jgi:hypothetical protein
VHEIHSVGAQRPARQGAVNEGGDVAPADADLLAGSAVLAPDLLGDLGGVAEDHAVAS